MLSPNYLLHIAEASEELAAALHSNIMQMVIERLMARLDRGEEAYFTSVDEWNMQVYQEAGGLLEDVAKQVGIYITEQNRTAFDAFLSAAKKSWKYDSAIYKKAGIETESLEKSPYYWRLLQRNYEKTAGDLINLTGTIAKQAQQAFIREAAGAYFSVASGAEGYVSAVRRAIDNIVRRTNGNGLYIDYPSGHRDTIETATLRAVRTGASQSASDITQARLKEIGWDIVLVSAHAGARPEHALWQGQFYSISGNNPDYPQLRKLADATGLGDVTGLCGANCRHSYGPAIPGYNPYDRIDLSKSDELYEKLQQQRKMERQIRATKDSLMEYRSAIESANTDAIKEAMQKKYDTAAKRLFDQNSKYNDYCSDTGLKRQQDRLYKAGWTRSEAAKASSAARKE